jgi:HD superfamily phosphohydrolase YqeK
VDRWFAGLEASGDATGAVRRFLRQAGRLDTLRHVSTVAAAGRRLARRVGVPLHQVDLAASAHDLAAVVPLREITGAAEALDVRLSAADRLIPQVVHGAVAAAVLRHRLGVGDEDVLNAVTYHSTLRAGASDLEALIFIADKLAYDSTTTALGYHPALWAARTSAPLRALCWIYLDWAVREGPGLGWRLHPLLLAAHADLAPTPSPTST